MCNSRYKWIDEVVHSNKDGRKKQYEIRTSIKNWKKVVGSREKLLTSVRRLDEQLAEL